MAKLTWAIVLLLTLGSCGKETNLVPNVGVNIAGFFTPDQLSILNRDGGAVFLSGGVAGIVIARNPFTGGYCAYDRCSTVNPEKRCAIVLDEGYSLKDPCSGAKYSVLDGGPTLAPAKIALKTYNIRVTGNNYQVTN